jgi:sodium/hydrogen antiporter
MVSMDKYILFLAIIGLAAFAMVWMPAFTKRTGISYSIFYVLAGALIYALGGKLLPNPMPENNVEISLRLTEMVVIISLMGTGIKIDQPFSVKKWSSPLKLVSGTMIICITAAAFMGYYYLGLDLASSLLLGAVLAPTDPVLASDVQVGPPNEKLRSETKFALTAEAGLNDGMAFPFTWLAITVALAGVSDGSNLTHWLGYDFFYRIIAGIMVGIVAGRITGHLVFNLPKKYKALETRDGFLAIALTLFVYGLTELIHGYGFIAVFVSAITLRHFEKEHDYHEQLHAFTDQIERLLVALILILFGGALVNGLLSSLNYKMVLFSLAFLFIIRPLAAYIFFHHTPIHWKEKFAISFFGIRGMGSIFYLVFAFKEATFGKEEELWALVSFTILISLLIHGITATPFMKHLKKNVHEKES